MDLNYKIVHNKLRESRRKLINLEVARRKRSEINDLINKEIRIKNGAQNLLNVCNNEQTEEKLRIELAFAESNIKYLKDQLAELNCDWTISKIKYTNTNVDKQQIYEINKMNSVNNSSSNSSSSSTSPIYTPDIMSNRNLKQIVSKTSHTTSSTFSSSSSTYSSTEPILKENSTNINNNLLVSSSSCSSNLTTSPTHVNRSLATREQTRTELCTIETSKSNVNMDKSADIMIYLNLKETLNNLDFSNGFKSFISNHYKENPNGYLENIRNFNYFRETTIRLSYEPSMESIHRMIEYFNTLNIVEKRFFQNSQCTNVHFTWYDSINGIESTQKSVQFEKASVLFNCCALYTQLAAICCDGNNKKLNDQMSYWLRAAGTLNYLNANFSNSPSLDMSSFLLEFFIDVFHCQAYEIKAKIMLTGFGTNSEYNTKQSFVTYLECARIYSHISQRYNKLVSKLIENLAIKNYVPELWFYIIKVKSLYYQALSHYYTSTAISCEGLEDCCDDLEIVDLYNDLHDKSALQNSINLKNSFSNETYQKFFKRQLSSAQLLYSANALRDSNRFKLARVHMRESIVWLEEAMRQHSFCRKFSTNDYLHYLLRYYHDISLDKFMRLESVSSDFDDETFDLMPIKATINERFVLKIVEPNFLQFEARDFFNLIGPIKVYNSENDLSMPFNCVLRKLPNQQTFGITVKGDCPVRVNHVDANSYAQSIGVREGDYIIGIQDIDVRWAKHNEVVGRIRSHSLSVKLTLITVRPIPREMPIFCEENEANINNGNNIGPHKNAHNILSHKFMNMNGNLTTTLRKKIFCTNFDQNVEQKMNLAPNQAPQTPKAQKLRTRLFRLPKTDIGLNISPLSDSNIVTTAANKLCNLAKSSSSVSRIVRSNSPTKLGYSTNNQNYHKSINNIDAIYFNKEDDEVDGEQAALWQNLKSISKFPFTNTITLGRRLKKNVRKLSIFNTFSVHETKKPNEVQPQMSETKDFLDDDHQTSQLPPLPINFSKNNTNLTNKMLKKAKKLKKLEKLNNVNSLNTNTTHLFDIYKTI